MNPSVVNVSKRHPRHAAKGPATRGFATDSWLVIGVLLAVSLGLQSIIFAPISVWPCAYVCLVPWILVIGWCSSPRRVYVTSYLLGFAFFLINVKWIAPITVAGYVALSAYLAAYFPLVACPIRHAVRRRRVPMTIAVPVIWVGSEFLRAIVISGFPWFFLSHSQYRILPLIQISDLVGAYGVSFMVAMVNGALADAVFTWLRARTDRDGVTWWRRAWPGLAATAVVVLGVLVYGLVQIHRDTSVRGPKIAVIQGDYPSRITGPIVTENEKARRYFSIAEEAAATQPDLFLLPETPWTMFLNRSYRQLDDETDQWVRWSKSCFEALQDFATRHDAELITGAMSRVFTPLDRRAEEWKYNSAFVFRPDGSQPERYDKVHTVYFGETVPFRFGRLRFLYIWFNSLSPFGQDDSEYTLTPGKEFNVFEMGAKSQNGKRYRFGIPICYEDVMPYVSRRFVIGPDGNKQVDFLLNISNDGWFLHSNELPQHLAICSFRAVENRVGIARAVNTGISGFIDADGRIHDLVTGPDGRSHGPGIEGWRTATIDVDTRCSLYSRTGDVFALICCLLWGAGYADYLVARVRGNRAAEPKTTDRTHGLRP
ncbi:MAG: apolipoprotein N-acyltransferase [Phycisphaerales bacterium]|nr:MAG: apolipoprotein N-acyltransferase [Phycisphaerales bacterium]